jgi:hypothetical protein
VPAVEPVRPLLRRGDRGVRATLGLQQLVVELAHAAAQELELGALLVGEHGH